MLLKTMTSLAFAAALVAGAATVTVAQAQPAPDNGRAWVMQDGQWVWSPQLNIKHSEHYTRMVATDPAFREARMRKECGPITDPTLHQNCIASFHQEVAAWHNGNTGAFYGSSTPPVTYPSGAGD